MLEKKDGIAAMLGIKYIVYIIQFKWQYKVKLIRKHYTQTKV
jgi:hypothetical protein